SAMDPKAEFGRLYEAHRTAVYAYLLGRTADRAAAADLLQEVFLRVWRHLPEAAGKPPDGQPAWIFTAAGHLALDSHRRAGTREDTEAALARQPAAAGPAGVEASAPVIAGERVAALDAAIRRLPEQQRTTLAMAAAGGMTSAEIADVLGVPAGTVRYR